LRTEHRRVDLTLFEMLQSHILIADRQHFGVFFRVDMVFSEDQSRQHVRARAGSIDSDDFAA
jgi:hypothetical protein